MRLNVNMQKRGNVVNISSQACNINRCMKHKMKALVCKANVYFEYFNFLLNIFRRRLIMVR